MSSVKVKTIRSPKFDKAVKQLTRNAKQLVGEAGNLVRNTAVESIAQGAKSGVTYELYKPRRTHTSSASGEPPASDTGFLVNHIFLNIDTDGLGASVESTADYSVFLEFGTTKMAARPFMQPALDSNLSKIRQLERRMIKAK